MPPIVVTRDGDYTSLREIIPIYAISQRNCDLTTGYRNKLEKGTYVSDEYVLKFRLAVT